MESDNKRSQLAEVATNSSAEPAGGLLRQMQAEFDKLKEIDVAGIEPLLPPTWKKGRFE